MVGAQLFPQLGAAVSKSKERYSIPDDDLNGTINRSQASATVVWELDVWGRLRAQRASSEAEYQATALDYAYARQSLAATVAKVWYTAIEAHQLLQLAEQSVRVFSEQLKLVTIRQTAGKGTDLDVVDTRAKVETAKDSAESTRQAYNTIRRALELLLGVIPPPRSILLQRTPIYRNRLRRVFLPHSVPAGPISSPQNTWYWQHPVPRKRRSWRCCQIFRFPSKV